MRSVIAALAAVLIFLVVASTAQETVVTKDGLRVLLRSDGTWSFVTNTPPVITAAADEDVSKDLPQIVFLGVNLRDLNSDSEARLSLSNTLGVGSLVYEVYAGSSGDLAGLKVDDVIVEYGSLTVANTEDLLAKVRQSKWGHSYDVRILRDGKKQKLIIKYGNSHTEVATAWVLLGELLWRQDKEKALTAFQHAVSNAPNNVRALIALGKAYYNQEYHDNDHAVECYRKAAELGSTNDMCVIAELFFRGRDVESSKVEAVRYYRMAAERNCAEAQDKLGDCYSNGWGIETDEAEALKWYRKAADQGVASAQRHLGYRYKEGLGVTRDLAEALNWYRKAAKQGFADAEKDAAEIEAVQAITSKQVVGSWSEQGKPDPAYSLTFRSDGSWGGRRVGRDIKSSSTKALTWHVDSGIIHLIEGEEELFRIAIGFYDAATTVTCFTIIDNKNNQTIDRDIFFTRDGLYEAGESHVETNTPAVILNDVIQSSNSFPAVGPFLMGMSAERAQAACPGNWEEEKDNQINQGECTTLMGWSDKPQDKIPTGIRNWELTFYNGMLYKITYNFLDKQDELLDVLKQKYQPVEGWYLDYCILASAPDPAPKRLRQYYIITADGASYGPSIIKTYFDSSTSSKYPTREEHAVTLFQGLGLVVSFKQDSKYRRYNVMTTHGSSPSESRNDEVSITYRCDKIVKEQGMPSLITRQNEKIKRTLDHIKDMNRKEQEQEKQEALERERQRKANEETQRRKTDGL